VTKRWAKRLLAAMTALGIGPGCMLAPEPVPAPDLGLWSEFLPDAQVRAALPWLASEGLGLMLAVPASRIGDESLARLVVAAAAVGVEVRAWLLLDEQDGYWPNEHNVAAMRTASLAFAAWREQAALPIDWVVFDLEMALARSRAVADAIATQGLVAGLETIKQGRDPERFAANRAKLAALVGELHLVGLKVMCVTYPMVLDDRGDGDDDIQDELDVPVYGVPWDQAAFMVYQSLIYDLSGSWHGPDIVHSYAASAAADFGERAAVALGIVGTAGIDPVAMPYPDAATLRGDQAAAVAAGVRHLSIYSLDGLLAQPDRAEWVDRAVAPRAPEPADAATLRGLIGGMLDD
jgi:hypothetical protein